MTRTVPSALQTHLNTGSTTITQLLLIKPVTPGYSAIGITLLDRDVTYNDGAGSVAYLSKIGMVPAALVSSLDMTVDNTEVQSLIPEFDLPISEADIVAGVYDYAEATIYQVNYEDLSMGHVVLGYGTTGQMRVENGLSFWTEFTALSKLLKQSIVEKDSITCRAVYGSQPIGTGGGVFEQRFPCGKDASAEFTGSKAVTSAGAEPNSSFTASALGAAANTYVPGILVWLTGKNAGRTYEVDSQTAGGAMTLTFETMFPILVGDTFKVRPDCTKWVEGANGCKAHFSSVSATEWKLHYRGEPLIPIADGDAINTPGATVPASLGGGTTAP
jgi:uncharacterized phage protein (TIGR02218 family)